ncbi:cytochrome P450 6a22-like [Musca vetustissima]|uniref:cytochrome P450 6a22-like n=1 Tax=Musca vetustissima TaxID=27455 RepID=UPI002AB7F223|nr:cytochrome P450 6a22-like [Musca vetustissima]
MGLVLGDIYEDLRQKQKPFKVVLSPFLTVLVLQDIDLIKDVMIKEFEKFPERGFYTNYRDPLSTNLVRLEYKWWKPIRQKLTPVFSPAKMQAIFPTLHTVCELLASKLKTMMEEEINSEVPIYDLCARFTTDVIGNVAFGIEFNSLKDSNSQARRQGIRLFDYAWHPILDSLAGHYCAVGNFFNIKLFKPELSGFFINLVRDIIDHREKNGIRQADLMDTLIELKKEDQKSKGDEFSLSLELIVGQVFGFFGAGFETSSNTLTYALYELAKNPEIQEKARQSVKEVLRSHGNTFTYDNIREMQYLKQVLKETLRLHPPAPYTVRVCRRPCVLKTKYGALTIPSDTKVMIPIYGIHHNPDYYPEPYRFLPERFDEISDCPPALFIPFGLGPRTCIGKRLANMMLTLSLAMLLTRFRFSCCAQTPRSLDFESRKMLVLSSKENIVVKVEAL